MKREAKRLERYLSKELGWETDDHTRTCACGHKDYDRTHKFCAVCGVKLPPCRPSSAALLDLEEALKYAMKA